MAIYSGKARMDFDDGGKITGFCSDKKYVGFHPFRICLQGEAEGQFSELTSANCVLAERFSYCGSEDSGVGLSYYSEKHSLRVKVKIEPIGDTGVFRICSQIENEGAQAVDITRFSSAFICGFGGNISEKTPDFLVHYFESNWQAEARHRQRSLQDLGMTFVSTHFMSKSFTLLSQGGYTTAKYFPTLYLEDKAAGNIRFMCAECDGGWRIQLGHSAAYSKHDAGMYLESDAISSSDIGTDLLLSGGQTYISPWVLVGYAEGGMDEATEALTKARRALYKNKTAPLMFNDYMNCLWCNVNGDITYTLAKKAAALGAEGYCIDSGWFVPFNDTYGKFGDWTPAEERFAPYGFRKTVERIKDLGLVPGVWTELEVCSDNADAFALPDEYFVLINGKRAGGADRFFFNFKNRAVRDFLTKKIAALYDMGVRYIKNDYNAALRWSSAADAIYENQRAAIGFYKSLTEKFPDLYIENCGSGGMRADYGMLKNFCLQSISDQEIYFFNPPILQGILANILPEHAGSWAYPYPDLFDTRGDPDVLQKTAAMQADGRQTVFNMVNGIVGNVYLSGRIDISDGYNDKLIGEGLRFFKRLREFKNNASAVYPTGFADICDPGGFATLGLIGYDKEKMYLFFWKFDGVEKTFGVPLKKWAKGSISVKTAYPSDSKITACAEGDILRIHADDAYSAAVFEIDF